MWKTREKMSDNAKVTRVRDGDDVRAKQMTPGRPARIILEGEHKSNNNHDHDDNTFGSNNYTPRLVLGPQKGSPRHERLV